MAAPKNMPFDGALWALKRGAHMQRAGWNAPEQWVALIQSSRPIVRLSVPYAHGLPQGLASAAPLAVHDFRLEPFFVLMNARGELVTWVPSVGDLLANDWREARP